MTKKSTFIFSIVLTFSIALTMGVLSAADSNTPFQRLQKKIQRPVFRKGIDLTITKLEVVPDSGTVLIEGQKAWVKCTWKRTGPQPATVFRLNKHIDSVPLGLAIGSTVDHTTTGTTLSTPWIAVAGGHIVKAFVDCQGVVTENNESNNKARIRIKVKRAPRPDLSIVKLEVVPDSGTVLIEGQKAWVKCTWKRTGPKPATVFRLNKHIDGAPLGLAIGSTVDHTTMGTTLSTPWIAVAGGHIVKAFVDCQGVVTESNESNNKAKIRIKVKRAPRPDLSIVKLEVVPDSGTVLIAGQKAWVRTTWKRTGPQPATVFRLNKHIDSVPLGLAIGSTVDHTTTGTTLSTPWIAVAGGHIVTAFVDCQGVVTESNESNNKAKIRIKVRRGHRVIIR